jgi:hypothetical protein
MKYSLSIAYICLITTSANANSELGIALQAGLDAATLDHDNRDNRYGFSGGLAALLRGPVTSSLAIAGQIELLYTQRGARTVVDGAYLGRSRQHYLDAVLAGRPELRLGRASVYLVLGGGVSILMNANSENASGATQDITGDLRRIDVELIGGAGVALTLPRSELGPFRLQGLFVEARYDLGLFDTDPANGGFKNRTSSVMLGVSLSVAGQSP